MTEGCRRINSGGEAFKQSKWLQLMGYWSPYHSAWWSNWKWICGNGWGSLYEYCLEAKVFWPPSSQPGVRGWAGIYSSQNTLVPVLKQKRTKGLDSVNMKAPPVESPWQQSALILRSMRNNAKCKWLPKKNSANFSFMFTVNNAAPYRDFVSKSTKKISQSQKNDKIKIGNLTWSCTVLIISKPGKYSGPQK